MFAAMTFGVEGLCLTVSRLTAWFRATPAKVIDQLVFHFCLTDDGVLSRGRRTCRFYLTWKGVKTLLGRAQVADGEDMDSTFPIFHRCNFPQWHVKELIDQVYGGAVLSAEADFDDTVEDLAYLIEGTPYWCGGAATCQYLGCEVPV